MNNVSLHWNSEISSNRPRLRSQWIRNSYHWSCRTDNSITFPYHCYYWPRNHWIHKCLKIRPFFMLFIMRFYQLLMRYLHSHSNQLKLTLLESMNDVSHERSLHSFWLNQNKCLFNHFCFEIAKIWCQINTKWIFVWMSCNLSNTFFEQGSMQRHITS